MNSERSFPEICFNACLFILFVLLISPLQSPGAESQLTRLGLDKTNALSAETGWLRIPENKVMLTVHHEPLRPDCRREASELTFFVIQELLHANYTVHLSPSFVDEEISYYKSLGATNEAAAADARLLSCLETARTSGRLDWDCFRKVRDHASANLVGNTDFPWSQPPGNPAALQLSHSGDPPIPELELIVHWNGVTAPGSVGFSSRLRDAPLSMSGKSKLWNPSASLRLRSDGKESFQKDYPAQPWQRFYHQISDTPLQVTTLAILEDVRAGLKGKPETASKDTGKKKVKSK